MKGRLCSCVLLLLLIFVAVTPMLTVKSAKATYVATQWGYLYPNPPDYEQIAEMWICNHVYYYFENEGWGSSNAWGEYTQQGYVTSVLQYCQDPNEDVDWATIWWVGDFTPDENSPPEHRGCYGYNDQITWDYNVYIYANYYLWFNPPYYYYWQPIPSKQYFSFIWTCANGGLYFDSNGDTWNVIGITYPNITDTKPVDPPNNPFTDYGYVENPYSTPPTVGGMPYGFTGSLGMSTDGYSSPSGSYCYIGWENISPFMINETANDVQYKWFPHYFYRYALGIDNNGEHATIAESLDYAALRVFGSQTFDATELYSGYWVYKDAEGDNYDGWWYCRMRVFGNSNLILPD